MIKANAFDYYQNKNILAAINTNVRHIRNKFDREDCQQEIWSELYSFMPIGESEAIDIVNRIARRFKYYDNKHNQSEIGLTEAGII